MVPGCPDDGSRQHTGELPTVGGQRVQQGHVVRLHLHTLGRNARSGLGPPHLRDREGAPSHQPNKAEGGHTPAPKMLREPGAQLPDPCPGLRVVRSPPPRSVPSWGLPPPRVCAILGSPSPRPGSVPSWGLPRPGSLPSWGLSSGQIASVSVTQEEAQSLCLQDRPRACDPGRSGAVRASCGSYTASEQKASRCIQPERPRTHTHTQIHHAAHTPHHTHTTHTNTHTIHT